MSGNLHLTTRIPFPDLNPIHNDITRLIFHLAIGILSLISSAPTVYSQEHHEVMHFDQITIQDKLSHNTVRCLLQDRAGYIWIGTQNGLNKYDGYTFKVFRTDPETGFVGNSITALLEDSEGNLWIGTAREGVNLLPASRRKVSNLKQDSAFLPVAGFGISSIREDSQGNIWITTVGGGVLKYSPKTGESQVFTSANSGLSNDLVFDMAEDQQGGIWLATAGLGVNYLESNDTFSLRPVWSPDHGNLGGYRKKLLVDDEHLWIGTEGSGLYRLGIQNGELVHYQEADEKSPGLNSNGIIDLHKRKNGQILIATDGGGLNILDPETDTISTYVNQPGDPSSLNSNALLCFLEDRSGNVWIGTYNGGINIYNPNKTRFEFLSTDQQEGSRIENWSILSIYQLNDGTILAGTDGDGLFELAPNSSPQQRMSIRPHPINDLLSGNVVKSIHEDRTGKLWLGTFSNGLNCYDPATGKNKVFRHEFWNPASLGGDNVWSISEDQSGNLWFGTLGGGITRFNPGSETFTVFGPNPDDSTSLADANVMVVFVDSDDRLWVGSMDKGLDLWLGEGKGFKHFTHDPLDSLSISDHEIRTIFEDKQGNLWIGTEGGGLNKWLGGEKFERFDNPEDLIASSVMAITEDIEGNLWITTYEGISCFDPDQGIVMNANFRNEKNNNQFNQTAILTAEDGRLFFGGIKGIHTIYPDQIRDNLIPTDILLTGFTLFNDRITAGLQPDGRTLLTEPIETAEQISLTYTDNAFAFSFTSTDYDNTSEKRFEYQMVGFDKAWRETAPGQHQVSYTNLSPGSYLFRLRYREQEKSIRVVITPPFWQTLWFISGAVLLALGLVFGGIYFLIKRREAVFREQALQANGEILRLQNDKLAGEVDAVNSKLVYSTAQMAHKNEILTQVKEKIQEIAKDKSLDSRQLIRMLNIELEGENYWKEFNLYFNQVDKEFIQTLSTRHTALTSNDLRLCALIRLNLTTKEIASLLNISVRGVEQGRYRLKKRLNLAPDQNLLKYISEV